MDPQNTELIVSSLPKENGWLSDDNLPIYYYQGFWYYHQFARVAITISSPDGLPHFNPSSSDVIVCTTPKSGTTWLKALSFAIATRKRYSVHDVANHPLHSTLSHHLIPAIELSVAQFHKPRDLDLPLFATHLPHSSLPAQISSSGCKMVYIWRDPKDAFISRWLFAQKVRPNKDTTTPISLEEAFGLFSRGVSPFGPYWDHVLGYWKAYLDRPDKVLFLKYEDMMVNTEETVKRLAEFMGHPFSSDEVEEGVVEKVVELCSFESLRNANIGQVTARSSGILVDKDCFYRKGKVGDWKNYLTEEMSSAIDRITVEKFGMFGLI